MICYAIRASCSSKDETRSWLQNAPLGNHHGTAKRERGRRGDCAFSLTRYGEFYGMPIPPSTVVSTGKPKDGEREGGAEGLYS